MLVVALWIAGLVMVGWAAARWGWRLGSADVVWGVAPAVGAGAGAGRGKRPGLRRPGRLGGRPEHRAARAGRGCLVVAAARAATPDHAADAERSGPVDAADVLVWLVAGLVVTAAVGVGAFATLQYNEELQHWPLAATIAEGNFPPRLPFWPAWPAVYHYGFALLAAAVHHLSGLAVWWSIDVLTLVVALAVFWGVAALLRRAGAPMNLAVVGAFFVFFGGGWVPGWFAQRIPFWLTHAEGPLVGMQSEPLVVGRLFKSFALIVHEHPAALGLVCLIAYCHGWLSVQRSARESTAGVVAGGRSTGACRRSGGVGCDERIRAAAGGDGGRGGAAGRAAAGRAAATAGGGACRR